MTEEPHDVNFTVLAPNFLSDDFGTLADTLSEFRFNVRAFGDVAHHGLVIRSVLRVRVGVVEHRYHAIIFHQIGNVSTLVRLAHAGRDSPMAEFTETQHQRGKWSAGSNQGVCGWVVAYRAGHLMTTNENQECAWGEPGDFIAEDGKSGEAILDELLPYPRVASFFYGAVRGALAASHFYSVSGGWYGDFSFCGGDLHVDNQQGEYAIVQFRDHECLGVLSSGDPWRAYDIQGGIASAPLPLRYPLELLVAELERWCSTQPTGLFWSHEGQLEGPEPFRVLYRFGFETMGTLLLSDKQWIPSFVDACQTELGIAEAIISVARRYCSDRCAVAVEPEVLDLIFPEGSPAREDALETVTSSDCATIILPPIQRST
jgi:hypothetical protein